MKHWLLLSCSFQKRKVCFQCMFYLITWCFELYKQWHESSRNSLLFHNVMCLSSWRLSFFRQACLEIPSPSKWRDVQINQTWFVLLSQGNVFTQVLNLPRVRGKKKLRFDFKHWQRFSSSVFLFILQEINLKVLPFGTWPRYRRGGICMDMQVIAWKFATVCSITFPNVSADVLMLADSRTALKFLPKFFPFCIVDLQNASRLHP